MILIFTFFCRQTNDDLWTQILCVKCEELKKKCNTQDFHCIININKIQTERFFLITEASISMNRSQYQKCWVYIILTATTKRKKNTQTYID